MLAVIFYWLVNMSIISSVMGLIVLILRRIKRIPRRIVFWLWVAPFMRMVIPVGIPFQYSILTLAESISPRLIRSVSVSDELSSTLNNTIKLADSYRPFLFSSPGVRHWFAVIACVWLVGVFVLTTFFAFTYVASIRDARKGVHFKDNVYLSDKVTCPTVYGIVHPRVLIPYSYMDDDFKFILQHEKSHIRRKDNLWRLFGVLAVCVHWFNPFSWILLRIFFVDMELACDEDVMKRYTGAERKKYALTLLACTTQSHMLSSTFNGAPIRLRVERIVSYRQITIVSRICFSALIMVAIVLMVTNAALI